LKVEQIVIPKKKAEEEYEAYKQELRYGKTQFNKDMLSLYAHMKHGGKVIDLWEAMKLGGLNKDGDPKLAITNADAKRVRFNKEYTWQNNVMVADGGIFYPLGDAFDSWRRRNNQKIRIPKEFFPEWAKDAKGSIIRQQIETTVPIVPAKILNPLRSHKLENYHILWEVEDWKLIPKDPMLLKRITPNMFCVLATWDLTELERAVIRGRMIK
jgi:hypothetical protein